VQSNVTTQSTMDCDFGVDSVQDMLYVGPWGPIYEVSCDLS